MGRKIKYESEIERKAARKAYTKARIAKLRLSTPNQHKGEFDQATARATTACQALTGSIEHRVEAYRAKLIAQARKSSSCTRVRKEYKPINMYHLKGRKGRVKGTKNKQVRRDKGVKRGPRSEEMKIRMAALRARKKAEGLNIPYNIVRVGKNHNMALI